jgi:hypothetical protein
MRKILILSAFIFLSVTLSFAQFPSNYPFKTYVDTNRNLYVTGTSNGNIIWTKYDTSGGVLGNRTYSNPGGSDRGMDIATDSHGKIIIAGYLYDTSRHCNHIIVLKYSTNGGGTLEWEKTFDSTSSLDAKGLGIAVANDTIYVCGYATNSDLSTHYITIKYNPDGTFQWSNKYVLRGSQVATHILVDTAHVYIMGYKSQNDGTGYNDMTLLSYNLHGNDTAFDVLSLPNSDEIPTSFVFTHKVNVQPDSPVKSQLVSSGMMNVISVGNTYRYYMTVYFGTSQDGMTNTIWWDSTFGFKNRQNVATSVTTDSSGNPVVTGYYYNKSDTSLDFGTIKYNQNNGSVIWGPMSYDCNNGIDQASSIRRFGNQFVVSGYSQLSSTNNFVTQTFKDKGSSTTTNWTKTYQPSFITDIPATYPNHATQSYIFQDSSALTVAFAWNSSTAVYAVVKYGYSGNVIFTIDHGSDRPLHVQNSENENSKIFVLKQNFPNPFNPVTLIKYSIPVQSLVTLKVYDLLGREVAVLVNGYHEAGNYSASFDGTNFASGIYLYKLTAVSGVLKYEKIEKMSLIK